MRTTIHIVSARGSGATRPASAGPPRLGGAAARADGRARGPRRAPASGAGGRPRTVKELGDGLGRVHRQPRAVGRPRAGPAVRHLGAAPRGQPGAGRLWVGPDDATEEEGLEHLVRAYLRAFGPAPWRDIASWAGVSVAGLQRAPRGSPRPVPRRGGRGAARPAGAPLPDPDTRAPVRFLPHWDANLLVHARRTGIVPEGHRPRVFSHEEPVLGRDRPRRRAGRRGLVVKDGRIVVDPFEPVGARDRSSDRGGACGAGGVPGLTANRPGVSRRRRPRGARR